MLHCKKILWNHKILTGNVLVGQSSVSYTVKCQYHLCEFRIDVHGLTVTLELLLHDVMWI
jgi:hypothetical protein